MRSARTVLLEHLMKSIIPQHCYLKEVILVKVDNNDDGRNIFKSDVISYLNTLQNIAAIQNFDSARYSDLCRGEAIDAVVGWT